MLGVGTGAATLLGTSVAAADDTAVVSVWRLSADWGYAVPPKARTHCRCSACYAHAANAVYASRADALAARIHPCCVCQPYAIELLAADANALFPSGTSHVDLRWAGVRQSFEQAVSHTIEAAPSTTVSAPPPTSTTPPASTTPPTSTVAPTSTTSSTTSTTSSTTVPNAADVAMVSNAALPVADAEARLPVTGQGHTEHLMLAGAALIAAGTLTVVASSPPDDA
jgi:hypothetical protein